MSSHPEMPHGANGAWTEHDGATGHVQRSLPPELCRHLIDELADFVLVMDARASIRLWNRALVAGLAFSVDEASGASLAEFLVSPSGHSQLRDVLARACNGEIVSGVELSLRTKHAGPRIARWRFSALATEATEDPLVLAVGTDLTDRIELERRAAEAEAMSSLATLTTGLAHEIRNPLNAATLQLELLERIAEKIPEPELKQRIDTRAAIIHEELGRLNKLLNDFLDLAKPRRIELQAVDLTELVHELRSACEPMAQAMGLEIEVDFDDGPLLALGDRGMLKEALLQLLSNALEAMEGRAKGRARIACRGHGPERLELVVEDQGPGVPPQLADTLFSPFVTSKPAGTGLGLTIVKRIVDRHAGTVHIRSSTGNGTTACITLARAR